MSTEKSTEKWLQVYVYRAPDFLDCTNGGLTGRVSRVWVPCDQGEAIDPLETARLVPRTRGGEQHFAPEDFVAARLSTMFGGNFVWCSDTRFRRQYGDRPVPVHDRTEP